MAQPKGKRGLALMMSLGGGAPQDGLPPEEAAEPPMEEAVEMGAPPAESEFEEQHGEALIDLPAGFKAPSGVAEGDTFATTVRGKIVGGQFQVEEIGDMPVGAGEQAVPQEQAPVAPEEESPEIAEYKKKKGDEMAAKQAFQG